MLKTVSPFPTSNWTMYSSTYSASLPVPSLNTFSLIPASVLTLHSSLTNAAKLLFLRFKLRQCLDHIDQLQDYRHPLEQEFLRLCDPFADVLALLRTVPGLNSDPMTAISLLSEIGGDMSVFPTAKNFCSWAGCCPRNDQSGGKVKSTRISRAGTYLKPLLVQVANVLIRSKKRPEFGERYRRIKARRGYKKAIIAVCKMLLTAI